jgi:hypothetical protein
MLNTISAGVSFPAGVLARQALLGKPRKRAAGLHHKDTVVARQAG